MFVDGDAVSLVGCPNCSKPVIRAGAIYCSTICSERVRNRVREKRFDRVAYSRVRNRLWQEKRGHSLVREPWLWGAPPFAQRLPGGYLQMSFLPAPSAITLRETRLLHGLVSSVLGDSGIQHDERHPTFSLRPSDSACGWSLYVWSDEAAAVLSGLQDERHVDRKLVSVRFGEATKIASPVVTKRGRRRLKIETISPLTIRRSTIFGKRPHSSLTAQSLKSAIGRQFQERFGLSYADEDLRLEMVSSAFEPESTRLGGKFGHESGWSGVAIVECNAVAEWLLRVGSSCGIGARVGFGMGCIRVTEAA